VRRTVLETAEGRILVINSRDLTERKAEEARKSAHLRYQQRIAAFGQSALACRESGELSADAVQQALLALGADTVGYFERGAEQGELVARALAGDAEGKRTAVSSYDPRTSVSTDDPISHVLQTGEYFSAERCSLPFEWARTGATAVVPVPGDSEVRGALCAVSRGGSFAAEELNFLDAVAAVLSAGLKRLASEERLAYLAQFDSLTGLPNRGLLSDRFAQMIEQARRHARILGVLFVDLDDFKSVNDTLGHAAGDELLKEVARRLSETVRLGDTVARISGDEFAVVLADLARQEDAALVAQKIVDGLAAPFQVSGHEVLLTASVGIASYPADGDDAESLLGAADAAMYRAKQSGRNTYQFFTSEINQRTRARALLGADLRRALEREEFTLAYQPKFDLRTMRPCGGEALLRWNHPERGQVPPAQFVHVLEESGLIVKVGEWALARACADLKACIAASARPVPIAVNLSARQFRQHDLGARIRALIAEAGVPPELIELEITESHLMHDPAQAIHAMRTLRDQGVRIAIDDFGTGLLEPRLPDALPGGGAQDRPLVRRRHRPRGERRGDRAHHHRDGAQPGHDGDRGGRRDAGPGRLPAPLRLPPGAGLLLRPAHADRRVHPARLLGQPRPAAQGRQRSLDQLGFQGLDLFGGRGVLVERPPRLAVPVARVRAVAFHDVHDPVRPAEKPRILVLLHDRVRRLPLAVFEQLDCFTQVELQTATKG
jgi:diguanylate cyclase (GGDEF)-like protein